MLSITRPDPELRESFTQPDTEIRFALIKLAEVVSASSAEPIPGNLIVLPTPVVETPAMLTPRIRLSLGGGEPKAETEGRSTLARLADLLRIWLPDRCRGEYDWEHKIGP